MNKDPRLKELAELLPKDADMDTIKRHIDRAYEFGYSEGFAYGKTKGLEQAVSYMERQFGKK